MSALAQRDHRRDTWDRFWKDKDGHVVVYQHPNIPLIAWLVLTLASLFTNGKLADYLYYGALAALLVWSVLEMAKGVNYLRRLLGLVVFIMTVISVIKIGL